jgi:hypothetical protein
MNMSVGGYNFTDSRISTILKSESLGEAQQMGLLDRVIDFFRGGVKREAIETAFKQITAADRDNVSNPEAKQLARFEALRAMSKPEHAGKFDVDVVLDQQAGTWSYAFSVNGTQLVSKTDIPVSNGHDYVDYQDASILGRTSQALVDAGHTDALDTVDRLRSEFAARNGAQPDIRAFDADAAKKFTLLAQALSDTRLPLEIQVNSREAYAFSLNGQVVHSGLLQAEEQDSEGQFVDVIAARIQIAKDKPYLDYEEMLSNPKSLIDANVQCMVDGQKEQEELYSKLTDPTFSKATFTGLKESDDGATFVAVFGDKELIFSNRMASNNELRSDRLKTALQESNYDCLADITKRGHLTEADSMFLYSYTPAKHEYMGSHKEFMAANESERLDKAIADIKVGNTTLGALWKLNPTPQQVQATKQDDADLPKLYP